MRLNRLQMAFSVALFITVVAVVTSKQPQAQVLTPEQAQQTWDGQVLTPTQADGTTYAGNLRLADPGTLVIAGDWSSGEWDVRINPDGTVETRGENLDDAAKAFWKAVARLRPDCSVSERK